MFEIDSLSQKFPVDNHHITVFEDLTFNINKGEWVALTGASGCGKTSLLHLLGALAKPATGRVICNGNDYSRMSAKAKSKFRRKDLGFVFQAFNLFPELSAIENVMLPAIVSNSTVSMKKRAAELLEQVGLSHRSSHRPAELSGGEQQRVAIARALINDPKIILADEPTGNLDDQNSLDVMNIFERLHKEEGKTIVMVTHQHDIAERADRVLKLANGSISE